MITFKAIGPASPSAESYSQVKVKLISRPYQTSKDPKREDYSNGCPPIEFEVDFNSIEMNKDVTINWIDMGTKVGPYSESPGNVTDNKGVFYTDSNGLGMVKRVFRHEV